MQRLITDDLDALLKTLPPYIYDPVLKVADNSDLLEIVMDLGRRPEARYPGREVLLSDHEIAEEDIEYVVSRIGEFGDDNRAGIARTLHRISCIRNRRGKIVGLTCRVGRAVYGTIRIIEDLVKTGSSILMLGRPGVGKTTMLREVARVLADDVNKRVIVVDTSNEIGGDGDIPHPAVGSARRMQVPTPTLQHAVMIEAVENHMPEVIIIDEIGTELEAVAARTIAERGVQLVATAHGNTLENLMANPTLSDLIGGIQTVTLSDEEARRRGTQKSVLERKAPPTFQILVEIQSWDRVALHHDVAEAVDAILRGHEIKAEIRQLQESGEIRRGEELQAVARDRAREQELELQPVFRMAPPPRQPQGVRIYPFGINRSKLEQAIREMGVPAAVTEAADEADVVMTLKNYYKRRSSAIREAEDRGVPVYVLKNNTVLHMEQSLASVFDLDIAPDDVSVAMQETEEAIGQVLEGEKEAIDLTPQNAYIRRLQHEMAERYQLASRSKGREPFRHVRIFQDGR